MSYLVDGNKNRSAVGICAMCHAIGRYMDPKTFSELEQDIVTLHLLEHDTLIMENEITI